jgi:hypothetical protein
LEEYSHRFLGESGYFGHEVGHADGRTVVF